MPSRRWTRYGTGYVVGSPLRSTRASGGWPRRTALDRRVVLTSSTFARSKRRKCSLDSLANTVPVIANASVPPGASSERTACWVITVASRARSRRPSGRARRRERLEGARRTAGGSALQRTPRRVSPTTNRAFPARVERVRRPRPPARLGRLPDRRPCRAHGGGVDVDPRRAGERGRAAPARVRRRTAARRKRTVAAGRVEQVVIRLPADDVEHVVGERVRRVDTAPTGVSARSSPGPSSRPSR